MTYEELAAELQTLNESQRGQRVVVHLTDADEHVPVLGVFVAVNDGVEDQVVLGDMDAED